MKTDAAKKLKIQLLHKLALDLFEPPKASSIILMLPMLLASIIENPTFLFVIQEIILEKSLHL